MQRWYAIAMAAPDTAVCVRVLSVSVAVGSQGCARFVPGFSRKNGGKGDSVCGKPMAMEKIGRVMRSFGWRRGAERGVSKRGGAFTTRADSFEVSQEEVIMEGDVVEYPLPVEVQQRGEYGDWCKGLGTVTDFSAEAGSTICHIEPLVLDEPPYPNWILDERQAPVVVPLSEVRLLRAWFSNRMVEDRISNPHGEHAEPLWLVEDTLSPDSGSPVYNN